MEFKKITSPSNPHIKEAVAIREKRSRYGYKAFLIEGPRLMEMALVAGAAIDTVFFTGDFAAGKEVGSLLRLLSQETSLLFEVPDHILRKIADTETPQGISAIVSCEPASLDKLTLNRPPFLIVIDGIQDPGNLGTIIRTSDAAGADGVVILPGACDAFMPKTVRATAGSIFNIPLIYEEHATLLRWMHDKKISLIITSADAEQSVFDADLTMPCALVFGNEAHGVSGDMKGSADMILGIPIFGKAESLNVAASAAVFIYETVRQRRLKPSHE